MQTMPLERETITIATEDTLANTMLTTPIPSTMQSKRITRALLFLSGCMALLMAGFGIIIPIYPQRLQALGLGAGTLALMEGAFGLGMFLFSTPMGTLAGRIGRKPIIFLSLGGFVLTNLVLALVNVPFLFILVRFVEGVLVSGLLPASMAMVGDSVPVNKQGRWIGMLTTAQGAGIALGPGIGGFLYQAWGFMTPFFLTSGIALIATLLAFFMLPETLSKEAQLRARISSRREKGVARHRSNGELSILSILLLFAPLIIIDLGLTFTYPFVLPQYPFFFEQVLHYNAAQYGVIISMYGLALAVFPLFLGRLSDTLPKKPLVIIGGLLFPTLNVAMLFLHQYSLLIAASLVTGMGDALLLPALGAIYLNATNEQNRSQVMGVRGSAISLGMLLGPLTQAFVAQWITPQISFAIGVVIGLGITLIAMFTLKSSERASETRIVENER
ncbi:MAG TPA: hypothetical protein DHW02_18285 [Ktedonobacter sp.]|nr:hypothetical protein [Ktedonobacter sp.]